MTEKYFTCFDEAPYVIIGDEFDDAPNVIIGDEFDEFCDDTLIKFSIFLKKNQSRRLVYLANY